MNIPQYKSAVDASVLEKTHLATTTYKTKEKNKINRKMETVGNKPGYLGPLA